MPNVSSAFFDGSPSARTAKLASRTDFPFQYSLSRAPTSRASASTVAAAAEGAAVRSAMGEGVFVVRRRGAVENNDDECETGGERRREVEGEDRSEELVVARRRARASIATRAAERVLKQYMRLLARTSRWRVKKTAIVVWLGGDRTCSWSTVDPPGVLPRPK